MNFAERVLHKDGLILVLDKPAGFTCTPAGGGPCVTHHLKQLTFGKTTLPQVAHRLDREVTGCLVLGRHPKALRSLAALFEARKVEKTYWALLDSVWEPPALDWEWNHSIDDQPALTRGRHLGVVDGHTWLELSPVTGRTHQLRIHCAQFALPIWGDRKYGSRGDGSVLHLHARRVRLPLSKSAPPVQVTAPVPPEWPRLDDEPGFADDRAADLD